MSKAIVRRLTVEGTAFFLCDQQARFNEVIHNAGLTVAVGKSLVSAAKAFDIPLIVTEQYPKALGHTLDVLLDAAPESRSVFAKTQFSMVCESSQAAIDGLLAQQVRNVVLWGWESHVCVQQTCLDMLERGVNVWIVADGVSSQRPYDREVAIANMRDAGARISTAESILFELMRTKDHQHFKTISGLCKTLGQELAEFDKAGVSFVPTRASSL